MLKYVLFTEDYEVGYDDFKEEMVGEYNTIDKFVNNTNPTPLAVFDSKEEALNELHKNENSFSDWWQGHGGILKRTVTEFFVNSFEVAEDEDWQDGEFRDIFTL